MSKFVTRAALAGLLAISISAPAVAGTFTISDVVIDIGTSDYRDTNLTAGGTAAGDRGVSRAWARTDIGVNRLYAYSNAAAPDEDGNFYVTSLWGEQFTVDPGASGPVTISFAAMVDGSVSSPFIGEDEPPAFNFMLKAVRGTVTGFVSEDEDDFEDVFVTPSLIPVDGLGGSAAALLGEASLCPLTAEGGGCGSGNYDQTVALTFTLNPGEHFFVFGALMVEDLVRGEIDFGHTAQLTTITAFQDGAGGPTAAGLTSDSGRFLANGDGSFRIAAVPEPTTWAMMILGLGGVGATLRRRRVAGGRAVIPG